ncbi:MAG: site-2 protease family protein [Anaeroplasma sp.]
MKQFKVNLSFIITLIVTLFSPYQYYLLPFLLVMIMHECGHLFFIHLFNIKIKMISISSFGAYIDIDNYSLKFYQEILIFSGGIIFNLISLLFLKNEYKIVTYLFILFNLIPCYPLDGARIIKSIIGYFFNFKKTLIISYTISILSILICSIFVIKMIDGLIIINLLYLLLIIILEIKNFKIIYKSFLLHKYLNKPKLKKKKISFSDKMIDKLYRFHTIFTNINDLIISEEDILRLHFERY